MFTNDNRMLQEADW